MLLRRTWCLSLRGLLFPDEKLSHTQREFTMRDERSVVMSALLLGTFAGISAFKPTIVTSQEPLSWRGDELLFETFSVAAVDPATGESGVAVTTRRPCVGNGDLLPSILRSNTSL